MVALGGRVAEQILYNNTKEDIWLKNITDLEVTTGASNDLKQANQLARNYIQLFGSLKSEEYNKEERDIEQ